MASSPPSSHSSSSRLQSQVERAQAAAERASAGVEQQQATAEKQAQSPASSATRRPSSTVLDAQEWLTVTFPVAESEDPERRQPPARAQGARAEALAEIADCAGENHTAVWTEAGELFTFGEGRYSKVTVWKEQDERVPTLPRLVEALVGKKWLAQQVAFTQQF